ncbi:MAG: AMP-binding protein [Candidatus Omnitrophica bacterium]|nr:AMP-binding protein [Candidatus Omnitrophota bacterium]
MKEQPENIWQRFSAAADTGAARTALYIPRDGQWQPISYRQLFQDSRRVAQALQHRSVKARDRVGILMEPGREWASAYLGILSVGACAVPLDTQSSARDIRMFLSDAAVCGCFLSSAVSAAHAAMFAALSSLRFCVIAAEHVPAGMNGNVAVLAWPEFMSAGGECTLAPAVDGAATASLIYTSGTTGIPKAVMLTHANFLSNVRSIRSLELVSERDVFLALLPWHHSFPFMVTLLIPLLSGASIVIAGSLRGEDIARSMRETGVTILVAVPQLVAMLARNIEQRINALFFPAAWGVRNIIRLCGAVRRRSRFNPGRVLFSTLHRRFGRQLRFIVCGGAKMPVAAAEVLSATGFTVVEGYGLTETAPIVTLNPVSKIRLGSAGTAVPGVEVKIDQPDTGGCGEILIRGGNVMTGYYQQPGLTAEVMRDGWFLSGDIGRLDRNGYLWITGRKKEIIVLSSGKNIYPDELEAFYAEIPFIQEICIFAVPGIGEEERLHAVLVPDLEYFRKTGEVNIRPVLWFHLENRGQELPPYRRIKGVTIATEPLPRTRLGKLKRFEIRQRYAPLSPESSAQPQAAGALPVCGLSSAGALIFAEIQRQVRMNRPIRLEDNLELDLGIDSLGRVEQLELLEKRLGISIPDDLLTRVFTVQELIQAIEAAIAGAVVDDRQLGVAVERGELWADVLSAPPAADIIKNIPLSPDFFSVAATQAAYGFCRLACAIGWRLQVSGRQHLPRRGAFLLCPNHDSYLDGFLVAAALPAAVLQRLFFLGARPYFEHPLVRPFIRILRVIPIDSSANLIETMRACAYVLAQQRAVCIFPEGGRSIDGEVKSFKKGIGILIKELGVPAVPVRISGSFQAWPRTARRPRFFPIRVDFGAPITAAQLCAPAEVRGAADEYAIIAGRVREQVLRLGGSNKG